MPIYCKTIFLLLLIKISLIKCSDVLGCGGFVKSHVQIDFSKIDIELQTKQGIIKDKTNCAPNNGYYFIPVYDKGDYILKLKPPAGWSFTPTMVNLVIDGTTDLCSQGKDINFVFKGFGITGRVENYKDPSTGPAGIKITLTPVKNPTETREAITATGGNFFFTPVYPGSYVVSVNNKKWKVLQDSVKVQVAEGNTELPQGSLILGGYDISGFIKSEGRPVDNAHVILFQKENNKKPVYVNGCNKDTFKQLKPTKQVCHVLTDEQGLFRFPTVSPGHYLLIPYFNGVNTHFEPNELEVTVENNGVDLGDSFEITGFSVTGRVLSSKLGKPLKGAKILLDDEEVAITKENGVFTLQKVNVNSYRLDVTADHVQFDESIIKIDLQTSVLQDLYPSKYEVCGKVLSDASHTVIINSMNSEDHFTAVSKPNNGEFCSFLKPGKYKLHVSLEDQKGHVQFFPTSQTVELTSSPISGVAFSQLKATVTGKVVCLRKKDCTSLQVILKSLDEDESERPEDTIVGVIDNVYTFKDVRPGSYEVLLSDSNLCWEMEKQKISINSATEQVPPFVHNGYPIKFISSHATQVSYHPPGGSQSPTVIRVAKGTTSHCLKKPGIYKFLLSSCHVYENSSITFDTDSELNEVTIKAIKHSVTLSISADNLNLSSLYLDIKHENGNLIREGPLVYKNNKYSYTMTLSPSESSEITPYSDTLYFKPKTFTLNGQNDCADLGIVFIAAKGKVFQGKVIPPLAGVVITVESETEEILSMETDVEGRYKFSPLDDTKSYKINAKKDSYVLVGPNAVGDFVAQKLASVVVTVVDDTDDMPLQGALLSLSGDASYRSNLQTDQNGKISFNSLSPSQYFLRPMMKEYSFNPSSKIIDVQEGATVSIKLRGSRVAYSAFGEITSLNGQPEESIIIVAEGQGNCSHFSEDATSELTGQFRIRGLHPLCNYKISVKGNHEEVRTIERAVPHSVDLFINKEHHYNLKFMVFRPAPNTDVMVRVYSSNIANYKQLKVKLIRESSPSTVIHVSKLDNFKFTEESGNWGVIFHLPSVPLDGKDYSVQLESSLPNKHIVPIIKHFTASSAFKSIDLEYLSSDIASEQNIKQTSMWALFLLFIAMIIVYYMNDILIALKMYVEERNVGNQGNHSNRRKSNSTEYLLNIDEIEQIVQSINPPKRKTKLRKT